MKLVFGTNRAQKPIELRCPGGKVIISRAPHGTVLVQVVADAGEVEVSSTSTSLGAIVKLIREESEAL